jgi:hypothetical protein
MPTVLRVEGFPFRIYPADHQPPHIHAYKAGGVARIALSAPVIIISYEGMSERDVIHTQPDRGGKRCVVTQGMEEHSWLGD